MQKMRGEKTIQGSNVPKLKHEVLHKYNINVPMINDSVECKRNINNCNQQKRCDSQYPIGLLEN